MESQQHVTDMGGTMRLGAYPCRLARGSRAAEMYGVPEVSERHRHRYEVSNAYRDAVRRSTACGSAASRPTAQLVEIVELPDHPVVHRLPVPSRAQVAPDAPASAVRRLHRRGGRAPKQRVASRERRRGTLVEAAD